MDSLSIGRVVLMSIRPVFAESILLGKKRVEFRKRPLPGDVTHVLIYSTMPIGAVIGAFAVAGQQTTSPSTLWDTFSDIGGIDLDGFRKYFKSSNVGTGIQIGDLFLAPKHFGIEAAFGLHRPPQSYQYVDPRLARELLIRMKHYSSANLTPSV